MAPTPMTEDIECHSAIHKISRRRNASRLSPLFALLVSLWILNLLALIVLVVYAKHDIFTG